MNVCKRLATKKYPVWKVDKKDESIAINPTLSQGFSIENGKGAWGRGFYSASSAAGP